RQCGEHLLHGETARQSMVTGHSIIGAPNAFIILQIWKATRFGSRADSFRKNTGQKQRVIPDVNADLKTRAVVSRAKRRKHFEQVIHRASLSGDYAAGSFRAGKFGQYFGHIVGYFAVLNIRATENIAHQDVEIKSCGDTETTAPLQQRAKQGVV